MKNRPIHFLALLLALCAGLPLSAFARQGAPPRSHQLKLRNLPSVRQLVITPTDVAAELNADAQKGQSTPLRYAVPTEVLINPLTHGTWEQVPGGSLWRLRVHSAGATDLNLGFTTCVLPEGAALHIYSETEDYFQGPYSARDNKQHGQLWTPVIPGDRAVIELFVPADAKEEPLLALARINRGYRDLFHRRKEMSEAKAGSCNNDVICSLGDAWRNEMRSVARYSVNGSSLCTGTLINNGSNDFKNYFLTAAHCGIGAGNASSVVVYWNYESPVCGQHGGGSLAQNQSGAIFRMSKNDVDVTLIELEDIPDSNFHVYYSGWDRSGAAPAGVVGIHHPGGDEKSISFANNTLTTVDSCIGSGNLTHWNVVWNSGVTEPGSSGSGIWDPMTHRLIGTLSGGDSSCALPQGADCYGKFSIAWDSGNNASMRLRDWLDPANTSVTNVIGRDPNPIPLLAAIDSALVSETCAPTNGVIDSGEQVTVSFSLQNFGASNTMNLIATLLPTNGVTAPGTPQSYGIIQAGGPPVTRSFTFIATGLCGSVINPRLQLQDGTNSFGVLAFAWRLGTPLATFTQRFDTVTVPNLPSGWLSTGAGWRTTNSPAQSAPNSVYAGNLDVVSDSTLTSPSLAIANTNAQVLFHHYFDTEPGFDGGVLEISYNGGPFNDIITAGGNFVSGGYNDAIASGYQSPIPLRSAWSGNSGGFVSTAVNLPVTAAAQSIRLRWRMASDESIGFPDFTGWFVDNVLITDGYACCEGLVPPQIVETRLESGGIIFSFHTVPGAAYVTEFKGSMNTNLAWTPLQTNAGNGAKQSVTNSAMAATNRFFRVKAQ